MGWWGYYSYVPSASAAANARALDVARNQASYDLQVANIANNTSWTTTTRGLWDDFDAMVASWRRPFQIAGNLMEYHEATALIDFQTAIELTTLAADQARELAEAHAVKRQITTTVDAFHASGQSLIDGFIKIANAQSEQAFRVAAATQYDVAMRAWDASLDSPWSAMHASLGAIEVAWATDGGAAELAYAQAMQLASSGLNQSHIAIERDRGMATIQAERERARAIATARANHATLAAQAKYDYAVMLAGYVFTTTERDAITDDAIREREQDNQRGAVVNALAVESEYQQVMALAWRDYLNASSAARTEKWSVTGTASEQLWWDQIEYGDYLDIAESASEAYDVAMVAATGQFDDAAHAAWDELRTARADAMGAAHAYDAVAIRSATLPQSAGPWTGPRAEAERELAGRLRFAATALADEWAAAELSYATKLAEIDRVARVADVLATSAYNRGSAVATSAKNRSMAIVGATRRERSSDVRGAYETALYDAHAHATRLIADSVGTHLAIFQSAAAAADATRSAALQSARAAYERDISAAQLARIDAMSAAQANNLTARNAATETHTGLLAAADKMRSIALATADANWFRINAAIDVAKDELDVILRIDYDAAVATALIDLNTSLQADEAGRAQLVHDAWREFYLESTDRWQPNVWYTMSSGYSGWPGGFDAGWYAGFLGHYGSYGFAWMPASGYVYSAYIGSYAGVTYGNYSWLVGNWGTGGYGWRGWGHGYGWGYGWGWGGWYIADSEAWTRLQGRLPEIYTTGSVGEEAEYIAAVAEARRQRATRLSEEWVELAMERDLARRAYIAAVRSAESARDVTSVSADNALVASTTMADLVLSNATASADRALAVAREAAASARRQRDALAEVDRATVLASAEAAYQRAASGDRAAELAAAAGADASPALAFRASLAAATAQWLADTSDAYVTHAAGQVASAEQRVVDLAQALSARDVDRALADERFAIATAATERDLTLRLEQSMRGRRSALLTIENAQLFHTALMDLGYEVSIARTEKEWAIAAASADEQFELDRLDGVDDARRERTRKLAMAHAKYMRDWGEAEALRAWERSEALVRKLSATALADTDANFAPSQAAFRHIRDLEIAEATRVRDLAHAQAEAQLRRAETTARNLERTTIAIGEVAWRNAQAQARVAAHERIDDDLDLPWTDFLVAFATASRDATASAGLEYLDATAHRSAAESMRASLLADAYLARETTVAAAEKASAEAAAQFDLNGAIGRGAAMQVYTRALIDPSIEYLRALADVKYQFAWKVAQAQETYARDGNGDTLLGRLEFAESQRRAAERNVELVWYAVESAAQANKLLAEATIAMAI